MVYSTDTNPSADRVIELQMEIERRQKAIDELIEMRNAIVESIVAKGESLVASDGSRIVYSNAPHRNVLPEMVRMKYPDIYDAILREQLLSFEPKMTLGILNKYLEDEEIDSVVKKSETRPRISIRKSKEEDE